MARFLPLPFDPLAIAGGIMTGVQAIQTITQLGQAVGSILKPGQAGQGYPGGQAKPKYPLVPSCMACEIDRGNADCNWQFMCSFTMVRLEQR